MWRRLWSELLEDRFLMAVDIDSLPLEMLADLESRFNAAFVGTAVAAPPSAPIPAALPLKDGFEGASTLESYWETNSTANGRIQLSSQPSPAGGAQQLLMDALSVGPDSLNEAILHFDATGAADIELIFQAKEFNDDDHGMPSSFSGSSFSDGVALSVDGTNWHRLVSLTGSDSTNSYRAHKFNLSQLAPTFGITLGSDVRIKFQQYGNSPAGSDGIAFDNVTLVVPTAAPGVWEPIGPFTSTGGQSENVSPSNNVAGAVHTVLAHPTNPDILYIGGTNGGVWKTTNATSPNPTWTPLTDTMLSQSIGAMSFDLSDPTFNTIYVGIGKYSSYGRIGSARIGMLKSTDGGATFQVVDGGGVLTGKNIAGIHANGSVIVVAVNVADSFTYNNIGIYRSTDSGATFTQISSGNGSATGLPGGVTYDLFADPNNSNILYTSAIFADGVGGQNGVYKSSDQGATWTRVSSPAMNGLMTNNTSNLELAVGQHHNVYAAIINTGVLAGIFRSGDDGATWVQMDTPRTNENGTDVGLNPSGGKGPGPGASPADIAGGQGAIHFSLVADPTDANIVYVGGDRQPLEFQFPTSVGAVDFSGRLFRGDASLPAGQQWFHLTHSNVLGVSGGGTASSSSPHADSREMTFDAAGNIIEVDDGGVYRRTSPRTNTGDWFAISGNLQVTEAHDVAWDAVSGTAVSGNQDTGTTYQPYSGAETWVSLSTADGGDVLIDDVSQAGAGMSIRYSSFQNLGAFRRTTWDANGNLISTAFPPLTVTSGSPLAPAFVTKLALNTVDPTRLIVQGNNSIYESLDQGNTLTEIGAGRGSNSIEQNSLVYGGRKNGVNNPNVVWAATGSNVLFRSGGGGISLAFGQPTSEVIRDLTVHPEDWANAFMIDRNQVFATSNEGATWTDITGNLMSLTTDLRSITYVDGTIDGIVVGTGRGIFVADPAAPTVWVQLAPNMPNVMVYDMEFDPQDNVLVAGTLGRGAWVLRDATDIVTDLFNVAPVFDLPSYSFLLPETAVAATVVGAVSATDGNVGTDLAYSLSGTGAANFEMNSSTGIISVATGASLNAGLTPTYNLTASVSDGVISVDVPVTITITPVVAVADTHVFYKGTPFAALGVAAAFDSTKQLAQSDATSLTLSYANLLNTTLGINGVVLDIDRMPAVSLTTSDFVFRMSPQGLFNAAAILPKDWDAAPDPTAIVVVPATATTPARVRLEWANNAIANRWLQLQVLNTVNTGLPVTQVFYLGHLQGEMNGDASVANAYFVTNADLSLVNPIGSLATVTNPRDVDKNRFVLNADGAAIRNSVNSGLSLRNITIPMAGSVDEGRVNGPGGGPVVLSALPFGQAEVGGAVASVRMLERRMPLFPTQIGSLIQQTANSLRASGTRAAAWDGQSLAQAGVDTLFSDPDSVGMLTEEQRTGLARSMKLLRPTRSSSQVVSLGETPQVGTTELRFGAPMSSVKSDAV